MRNIVKTVFFFICYYLGLTFIFYRKNRKKQRILVFHHIIPDSLKNDSFEQDIVCTAESKFDRLLQIINKRFRVSNEVGDSGTAMITFDDGYRAALVADKVLSKYGNKGVFFTPVSVVNGGPLWVDRLMGWFAYIPEGAYSIGGMDFHAGSQSERQMKFSQLMDSLYREGGYDPDKLVSEAENQYPFEKLPIPEDYKLLRFKGFTSEEVETMKRKGHKIGGHSVRHDVLSLLTPEELEEDFRICSEDFGKLYNCDYYAYPYGHPRDVTENVVEVCRLSTFNYAVMNEYVNAPDDYKLSRINISRYKSRYEVEAALSGLTRWLKERLR